MSAGLVGRLAELRKNGARGILFTVVEGDGVGGKALVVEGGDTLGDGVPDAALPGGAELGEAMQEAHSTGSTKTSISPPQGRPTFHAMSSVIP